jgi:hypothetical protein
MAFWTIVQLGYLAGYYGWQMYKHHQAKKEVPRAASLDEFTYPRATEGDPVPLIYGTVRVRSPVVLWVGDLEPFPQVVNGVTVGYQYRIGMRLLLGRGNTDVGATSGFATLQGMYIGDVQPPSFAGPFSPTAHAGYYQVNADDFDPGNFNVGTNGRLVFYDGSWDLERYALVASASEPLNPPYRGQITVLLQNWSVGTAPTMPSYSFIVHNPVYIPGYESVSGPIANGAANPASVLYDLLTNEWGCVANAAPLVDVASFAACAATLQDEQHGFSAIINDSRDARSVVEQVLRQIDGVLYEDPQTRRYVLKLIREDYDPNTLPVFDPSNVVGQPKKPTKLWDEAVNEVRVIFTNPVSGYGEGVAVEQDLSIISYNGGRRRSAEFRFLGVTHAQLAQELAARELNFLSRPISRLRMTVNREAFDLKPGDVFRFNWPEWNGYTQVFRLGEIDYGDLEDGKITITAVQDRFAIQGTVFDPPDDEIGPTRPVADPIHVSHITEAPRWIMLKAYEQGHIANVDAQRGYFLAKPEGSDSRYQVQSGWSTALQEVDMPGRVFPGTFTVETEYAKTTSAYDTSTHLRIENVVGWTPGVVTTTQIQVEGRNVIGVLDANGALEIMAYEDVIDLGGGVYRLLNVWRGLLDTVPATHAVGAQGFVLPGSYLAAGMGRRVYTHGTAITAYTQGAAGSSVVPVEDSPEDTFTARSRSLLPYPGSDLLVNGTKAPVALEEGGVTLQWNTRDRLKTTITRGNASAETPEANTTYDAVAVKGDPVTPGSEVSLASGVTTSSTTQHPLGAAGHGALQVGVRTKRTGVALSDGTTPIGGVFNWQTPLLDIQAHHWRNLLLNPRFASGLGLNHWDAVTGVATTSNSGGLGNNSFYVTGQSGTTVEIRQTLDLTGYNPKNYSAALDFYVHNGGDSGDTVQVELISLDAATSVLQTQTYGASDPGNAWVKQTLSIADLHDDTKYLRVRIILNAVGELDSVASCRVTELCLRVGQVSAQLLLNPSFEAGLTSWTAGGSGMQVLTTTPYELTNYVRPQDGASSTLSQTVALPTGYEDGVVVCECARMNDAADDTGTVLVECLDGGAATVASATTGAEAISPTNAWVRRRLVIDPIPPTTVNIRVTFTGTRVTGTPNNSCVDDFDLRVHKHLDPDEETHLLDGMDFVEQPLPRTLTDWKQHFPAVPPPDYAIYDGGLVGRLGIEPLLEAGAGCFAGGKAVAVGPEGDATTCYESTGRSDVADEDIHTAPVGDAFANFGTADPFTAIAFWKLTEGFTDPAGLMGRVVGSRGWAFDLDSDSIPRVRLFGASATIAQGGNNRTDDGSLHGAAMIYDQANSLLRSVDPSGSFSASTAGMGEIRATSPGKFRLMATGEAGVDRLPGQVVRAYLWRQALTVAQAQEVIRYAESPVAGLDPNEQTRGGTIVCVVGSDSEGVLVEKFGPLRPALSVDPGSGRVGLVGMPALTNLAPDTFDPGSGWDAAGSGGAAAVTLDVAADPTGHRVAARIVGDDVQEWTFGYASPLTFGSAGTRHLHFFARADDTHTMAVALMNAGDGMVDSDGFVVTPQWQLFTFAMAWDGSSSGEGYLSFRASNDGTERTIYLSPVMFLGGTAASPWPGTIPIGTPGATSPLLTIAPSAQFNREGEIEVELVNYDEAGVIANAHNDADDDDRRRITWPTTGGGDVGSEHYDGSGSDDSSALVANTTVDIAQPWKARLRWNRAGLVDGVASAFVVLRAEQGATVEQDGGRASAFSASTTALTRLALLHEAGATSAMAGLVFSARISARERKV